MEVETEGQDSKITPLSVKLNKQFSLFEDGGLATLIGYFDSNFRGIDGFDGLLAEIEKGETQAAKEAGEKLRGLAVSLFEILIANEHEIVTKSPIGEGVFREQYQNFRRVMELALKQYGDQLQNFEKKYGRKVTG